MLHNNSNASKKGKMTDQSSVNQDRHYSSSQRPSQFEANDSTTRRNKARIVGKLKGIENDHDIMQMKSDHIPISPDSSVNDRFNNFHNFRRQNNSSNLNKDFDI